MNDSDSRTSGERRRPRAKPGTTSDLLGDWTGRAGELEWAFKKATAEQHLLGNDKAKRANPTQPRKHAAPFGFHYVRWVWIGSPAAGTHVGVGMVADPNKADETPLWLLLDRGTSDYSLGRDLLQRSWLAPLLEDKHGVWIPIPVNKDRQWNELRQQILERTQDIRRVLSRESGQAVE